MNVDGVLSIDEFVIVEPWDGSTVMLIATFPTSQPGRSCSTSSTKMFES